MKIFDELLLNVSDEKILKKKQVERFIKWINCEYVLNKRTNEILPVKGITMKHPDWCFIEPLSDLDIRKIKIDKIKKRIKENYGS